MTPADRRLLGAILHQQLDALPEEIERNLLDLPRPFSDDMRRALVERLDAYAVALDAGDVHAIAAELGALERLIAKGAPPPPCVHCGEPNDRPRRGDLCATCTDLALRGYGWKRDGQIYETRGLFDGDRQALAELAIRGTRITSIDVTGEKLLGGDLPADIFKRDGGDS